MENPSRNNLDFRIGILAAALIVIIIGGALGASATVGTSTWQQYFWGYNSVTLPAQSSIVQGTFSFCHSPPPCFPSTPMVLFSISCWQRIGLDSPCTNNFLTSNSQVFSIPMFGLQSWNVMPAARTELFGTTNGEFRFNASQIALVRIGANIITKGASTAILNMEVFLSGSWKRLCFPTDCTNSALPINATGFTNTKWYRPTLPASGQFVGTNMTFRIVGSGGDGIQSPQFASIFAEFSFLAGTPTVGLPANPGQTDLDNNHVEFVVTLLQPLQSFNLNVTIAWVAFMPASGNPCVTSTVGAFCPSGSQGFG